MVTDQITVYIGLLAVIVFVNVLFKKIAIPIPLILVVTGMVISLIPGFPHLEAPPEIILNIFLPLLVYQAAAYTSLRDFKKNSVPIALLSIGHVIFITILVAVIMHQIISGLSWPLAFVLGAVISPPDDVAIIALAEKIHFPHRILVILTGEGLLNDATALTLFRFALIAVASHEFSPLQAVSAFCIVVVGETLYGIAIGHIAGYIRLKIKDPILQTLISLIVPFLAFLPPEKLGGSGIIATVTAGIVIGTHYLERYPPEVRLTTRSVWTALGFTLQNILFLLIGLDLRFILEAISTIPLAAIWLYSTAVVFTVIVGRFIWVYAAAYVPRFLFSSYRKNDPYPSWQALFIVSWAGMRGGISLAAALAVPFLPSLIDGVDPRDLLVFLVFCVIAATLLVQGVTLPWLLGALGISKRGQEEKHIEYLAELSARLKIINSVLRWLTQYKTTVTIDKDLFAEIQLRIKEYKNLKKKLRERISMHNENPDYNHELESKNAIFLSAQLIEIERNAIAQLWENDRIGYAIKIKLIQQLDHREKHLTGFN